MLGSTSDRSARIGLHNHSCAKQLGSGEAVWDLRIPVVVRYPGISTKCRDISPLRGSALGPIPPRQIRLVSRTGMRLSRHTLHHSSDLHARFIAHEAYREPELCMQILMSIDIYVLLVSDALPSKMR